MRVLVCGGRDFDDWSSIAGVLDDLYTEADGDLFIIEGGAKGADFLARAWARYRRIPFREFPAKWKSQGRAAGHIRNDEMLKVGRPDLVVAFPGGRGTASMKEKALAAGVEVREIKASVDRGAGQ